MTRILVQRGSSSSQNRSSSAPTQSQIAPAVKEEQEEDVLIDQGVLGEDEKKIENNEALLESVQAVSVGSVPEGVIDKGRTGCNDDVDSAEVKELNELRITEGLGSDENDKSRVGSSHISAGSLCPPPPPPPPPPPVRPPKPSMANLSSRRTVSGCSHALRTGSSRRAVAWPVVSTGTAMSNSQPPSPRSYDEGEGYNSGDEHTPHFGFCYDDVERERQFELDIRRTKGLEVKRMVEDGNCLFRAVADQVYGDAEAYDLTRQMSVDYMEREQDHFSQFITEGFTSYCKRKRRDKVYGNNIEIQVLSEMYNRPIHIYSYSTEPINIFHGSYNTDTPPIRLSYHRGNHYNALIDPRRLAIGAGLGFSNLQGNIDKDQVKAAIRAQQDQQIDNALLAEGRFYSDLELTEKEIERMVIEVSRSEYLGEDKLKTQLGFIGSSASSSEPSSSGSTAEHMQSNSKMEDGKERSQPNRVLSSSMQMMLSMGFSYLQAIEAYSIFGDDVDSMICYLLETGSSSAASGSVNRLKGKAME